MEFIVSFAPPVFVAGTPCLWIKKSDRQCSTPSLMHWFLPVPVNDHQRARAFPMSQFSSSSIRFAARAAAAINIAVDVLFFFW